MYSYDTLSQAMDACRHEGYTEDFELKENKLFCLGNKLSISHHEFVVEKYYRFEGDTDPSDESILYAISSTVYGLKGLLVSAYGMYADSKFGDMMDKLKIK